ncbi:MULTISPECIES: insoluble domain protein [unclassified Rhodococcus (in: high G+C Gram-positive bacteria)]|uniref:insoluble domain protein n=1 Tax=unclassified Rhodococcus (in: high G+C Gram-positive bacteria) TaxID=192944 RepID=UPI00096A2F42|nr:MULTISPECIES: insoluble domain protein [unclassified Rhodococcus (in: high G+C Gram-positive bacteria)]
MSNDITTGNRAARRNSGGRHRKAQHQATTALLVAAAVSAGIVFAPLAGAAPTQGGTTGGGTQGGTTTTPAPVPSPAYVPEAPAEPIYWTAPPAQQPQYTAIPNYDYGTGQYTGNTNYVAPLDYSTLHAPVAVEAAPIYIAPPEKIMIGDYHLNQANWITDEDRERTNNTAGLIRSQVATAWKSVGVEPDRADRVAAAQMTGAVTGFIAAGAACAVPGALLGGTGGGLYGAALGGVVPLPIPLLPEVTTGVAGTALGAVGGGLIAAAPCALAGGAVGFVGGTAFGAGDDEGQPIEITIPDVDQPTITDETGTVLDQWEQSGPAGEATASAIRDVVAAAPAIDQQARDWVAVQPGGQQVIEAVDGALETFFDGSAGTAAEMISTAFGLGAGAPATA